MEAINMPGAVGSEPPCTTHTLQPGEWGAFAGWLLPKTPFGRGRAVQETSLPGHGTAEMLVVAISALPGLLLLPLLASRYVPGLAHPFAIQQSLIFGGGKETRLTFRGALPPRASGCLVSQLAASLHNAAL